VGPAIWVVSLAGFVAVLVRNSLSANCARAAFGIAALGVAANLFVVLANDGYMPQSPEARLTARGATLDVLDAAPRLHNVVPSGPETRFGWLGDVIAEPAWLPRANVVSIGDVVLSAALACWAFRVIATAPSPKVRRPLADSQ
jgi:hypothetical protein